VIIGCFQCPSFDGAAWNSQISQVSVGQNREFMVRRAIDFAFGLSLSNTVHFLLKERAASIENDIKPTD